MSHCHTKRPRRDLTGGGKGDGETLDMQGQEGLRHEGLNMQCEGKTRLSVKIVS